MTLDNSNTCIGYKLAFIDIGMYSNINSSIKLLSASNISDEQVAIVNNLSTLLSVKSGSHDIIGFKFIEVNDLCRHCENELCQFVLCTFCTFSIILCIYVHVCLVKRTL